MRRLAVVALLHPLALAGATGQAPPIFRSEIGMVVVQATVRNQQRELVTGLARDAFTVYENGAQQSITLFRQGEVPVSVGILLDNSRSMREQRAAVESAAVAALRSSNPQDETFLMNFADKARVDVPLTSNVQALEAGVHRADSIGGTAMRDAIASAEQYLAEHATRPRKALVVITDGNDNASTINEEGLEKQTEDNAVVIYVIGLLDRDDPGKARHAREALERLAETSGGVAYYPPGEEQSRGAAADVARQVRHVYTIGYAPLAQALDGSYRKLRVVAKGPGRLSVKTRPGYRAARRS